MKPNSLRHLLIALPLTLVTSLQAHAGGCSWEQVKPEKLASADLLAHDIITKIEQVEAEMKKQGKEMSVVMVARSGESLEKMKMVQVPPNMNINGKAAEKVNFQEYMDFLTRVNSQNGLSEAFFRMVPDPKKPGKTTYERLEYSHVGFVLKRESPEVIMNGLRSGRIKTAEDANKTWVWVNHLLADCDDASDRYGFSKIFGGSLQQFFHDTPLKKDLKRDDKGNLVTDAEGHYVDLNDKPADRTLLIVPEPSMQARLKAILHDVDISDMEVVENANGEAIAKDGKPVWDVVGKPLKDEKGNELLDENGNERMPIPTYNKGLHTWKYNAAAMPFRMMRLRDAEAQAKRTKQPISYNFLSANCDPRPPLKIEYDKNGKALPPTSGPYSNKPQNCQLQDQNSNQWPLELLAAATLPPGQVTTRTQAQEVLWNTAYHPSLVRIPMRDFKRFAGCNLNKGWGWDASNIANCENQIFRGATHEPDVLALITVQSLVDYLRKNDWLARNPLAEDKEVKLPGYAVYELKLSPAQIATIPAKAKEYAEYIEKLKKRWRADEEAREKEAKANNLPFTPKPDPWKKKEKKKKKKK